VTNYSGYFRGNAKSRMLSGTKKMDQKGRTRYSVFLSFVSGCSWKNREARRVNDRFVNVEFKNDIHFYCPQTRNTIQGQQQLNGNQRHTVTIKFNIRSKNIGWNHHTFYASFEHNNEPFTKYATKFSWKWNLNRPFYTELKSILENWVI
jgi:hypothetical protein